MKNKFFILASIFLLFLFNCNSESSEDKIDNQEINIIEANKAELKLISGIINQGEKFNKLNNIREVKLDLSEKKGSQYLYFVAEENGETKIFAQSIENIYLKDFSELTNPNSAKASFEGGTQHSCSGCSVCRFKKDEKGKITGCLKYGSCTCSHTITTVEEDTP